MPPMITALRQAKRSKRKLLYEAYSNKTQRNILQLSPRFILESSR
jgi:hypothetical protein